jgi:septal ring factor EnvC (AmiA/AmiB activator)
LKKYRDYRKNQAEDIRKTQSKLSSKIGELNVQKTKKGNLLKAEESQKNVIQEEKKQTDLVANELKGREKELMAQIQQNQRTAKKLEASIKAQIAKEIELARKKAEEEAKKRAAAEALARKKEAEEEARRKAAQTASANKPATNNNAGGNAYSAGNQTVTLNTGRPPANAPATDAGSTPKTGTPATGTDKTTTTTRTLAANTTPPPSRPAAERTSYKLSLTPDVQALSNNFAANRGRLPWPVEKGFISGQYGRHPHPLFPKVMIDNNGIDIATSEGASVRAVFEGVVQTVTNIDGVMVMINHGEYFTIYTNLAGASVKAGDKVTAKQVIGRAGKNDDGDNMMNFQVWKISGNSNYATVNPSDWIAR